MQYVLIINGKEEEVIYADDLLTALSQKLREFTAYGIRCRLQNRQTDEYPDDWIEFMQKVRDSRPSIYLKHPFVLELDEEYELPNPTITTFWSYCSYMVLGDATLVSMDIETEIAAALLINDSHQKPYDVFRAFEDGYTYDEIGHEYIDMQMPVKQRR